MPCTPNNNAATMTTEEDPVHLWQINCHNSCALQNNAVPRSVQKRLSHFAPAVQQIPLPPWDLPSGST